MTLHELRGKVKDLTRRLESRELYTALLIIFVGFASFGLGRLSRLEEARTPIQIEQAPAAGTVSAVSSVSPLFSRGADTNGGRASTPSPGGEIVASRGGNKYHFPWCSGAVRIAEGNKIWFDSVEEAQKAGYAPAANCKGLK